GNVGPRDPHGDSDVRRLDRGSVVHAVAGHGHHIVLVAQRVDDPQLVLGGDAPVNVGPADLGGKLRLAHLVELRADHNRLGGFGDTQPDRYRPRGIRVIAGDHYGPDSRGAAALHGRTRLLARWIH